MALTSVLLSEDIERRLGEEGLGELVACLWAVDCQTCGELLGDDPPALCVDDSIVMATASLHHLGCRAPEWNDSAVIVRAAGDYVSYVTRMMLIPVAAGRRAPEPWPLMVVNPGLECVDLVRGEGERWRVGHGAGLAGAGLVRPGRELRAGVPVGGAVARVMESSVAVSFLSLYGTYLAPLTVGALAVTGEYMTGMIKATLTAVPKRMPVLRAKLGVFAVLALVVSQVSLFVTFLAGQAVLAPSGAGASLGDPGVFGAVFGTGLYITIVGLLGMALGSVIRNTAAVISTVFGVMVVLPVLVGLLPSTWTVHFAPYLPGNAGQAIMNVQPVAGSWPRGLGWRCSPGIRRRWSRWQGCCLSGGMADRTVVWPADGWR